MEPQWNFHKSQSKKNNLKKNLRSNWMALLVSVFSWTVVLKKKQIATTFYSHCSICTLFIENIAISKNGGTYSDLLADSLYHMSKVYIYCSFTSSCRAIYGLLAVYQHDNGRNVGMDIFYWPNLPCLWF